MVAQERRRRWQWTIPLAAVLLLMAVIGLDWGADEGPAAAEPSAARGAGHALAGQAVRGTTGAKPVLQDRTASLGGTIRDLDGEPIAGATVCAWARSIELASAERRRPTCTQTGEDGRYRIEGLLPVRHQVSASAPRYQPFAYEGPDRAGFIRLRASTHRKGVDMMLHPGGVEIEGRVEDISGGPIEGAWVSAGGFFFERGVPVQTNGSGQFSMWVEPGTPTLRAWAEGYTGGSERGVAPGHFFTIRLTPESVLVGRVVEAGSGKPVAEAKVAADGSYGGRLGMANTVFTDAMGEFRIEGLSPGRYKPVARTDTGYGMAKQAARLGLAETSAPIEIELHPATTIEGQVVMAGSGEPCSNGRVRINDKAQDLHGGGITDADGAVVMRGVLPGTYAVEIWCQGAVTGYEYEDVVVDREPVTGLRWEVQKGQSIEGMVVDRHGRGIAEASLSVRQTNTSGQQRMERAWTYADREGTFIIEGLTPGHYEIDVRGEGYVDPQDELTVRVEQGQDVTGLRIELGKGSVIEGRVVDPQGNPIADASVHADHLTARAGGRAMVADDGTFEIEGLDPGRYRVRAQRGWVDSLRAPGQTDDDIIGERIEVGTEEVAQLELVVEPHDGSITGLVVGEGGGPIADAFVRAQREPDSAAAVKGAAARRVRYSWGTEDAVLTDVDGRFVIEGLSPGRYAIRANRKGGGEAVVEHVEIDGDVTLQIESTGMLAGTVAMAEGGSPQRFAIAIRDRASGVRERERFFRTGGRWSLEGVPAGTYQVTVESSAGQAELEAVSLTPGEQKRGLALEIAGTVTLRGRLVDLQDGTPVPNYLVMAGGGRSFSVTFGDLERGGKHISDADGRFEVENVPAGKIRLHIDARGGMFGPSDGQWSAAWMERTVEAGEVVDLGDIRLAKRRTEDEQAPGDLGFELKHHDPRQDWQTAPIEVALIRPEGPAAGTGLKVGDRIISVDGQDVSGAKRYLYSNLTRVAPGTSVSLGLERGETIDITASVKP